MPARERRYVLRSLFSPGSHKFWKLKSDCARLVYLALLVHADDNGVVECDHQAVMAMTPRSQWTVNERSSAVRALVKSGLGTTYRQDNKLYMKINGFEQSQSGQVVSWKTPENPTPPQNSNFSPRKETIRESSFDSDSSKRDSGEEVFLSVRKSFRRIVGKSIGSLGGRTGEWSGLVKREGVDVVLSAVEIWARENKDFLKTARIPIFVFLKNSAEWIEAAKIGPVETSQKDDDETMPTVEDNRPPDYEETMEKLRREQSK